MRSPRTTLNVALIVVGAVLVLGAIGGTLMTNSQRKNDPGIAFCEGIRDSKSATTEDLSEQDYLMIRERLRKSSYQNIREHGIAIVDLVWQLQQFEEDEQIGALAYVPSIQAHMSKLQTACADQGIIFTYNTN